MSLLARMDEPDLGQILANRTPIERFDVESRRERMAVVCQNPHIFTDTLKYNLTWPLHSSDCPETGESGTQ